MTRKFGCLMVCMDGSEEAWEALSLAKDLAVKCDSERIVAVHIVPTGAALGGFMDEDGDMAQAQFIEYLEEQGELLLSKTQEELSSLDVEVELVLNHGTPGVEIVRAAKEHDADLVLIGNRGLTGLASMLLGSVSERVARTAPCSVMIVRK